MENEIVLRVEGIKDKNASEKIIRKIQEMPGIELVAADPKLGHVTIMGGDLDQLLIEDHIESLGYRIV